MLKINEVQVPQMREDFMIRKKLHPMTHPRVDHTPKNNFDQILQPSIDFMLKILQIQL